MHTIITPVLPCPAPLLQAQPTPKVGAAGPSGVKKTKADNPPSTPKTGSKNAAAGSAKRPRGGQRGVKRGPYKRGVGNSPYQPVDIDSSDDEGAPGPNRALNVRALHLGPSFIYS